MIWHNIHSLIKLTENKGSEIYNIIIIINGIDDIISITHSVNIHT